MSSQEQQSNEAREDQPLLGNPGDAVQDEDQSLWQNFIMGTGIVAQGGIIVLTVLVWASVLTKQVILFSFHPLLNSAGLLFVTEAILVLQPTHTQQQKIKGAYTHSALNNVGNAALLAGLAIILYNKIDHGGTHFESPHAIFGLITYILLVTQALVGITMFFTPSLFGSVSNAKSLYKYHRVSGYTILVLMFTTVALATQTTFNTGVLGIQLWAVVILAMVVLLGILPRVRTSKLGLK